MPFQKLKLLEDKLKSEKDHFKQQALLTEYVNYHSDIEQLTMRALPQVKAFIHKSIISCEEAIYLLGSESEEAELRGELEAVKRELVGAMGALTKVQDSVME